VKGWNKLNSLKIDKKRYYDGIFKAAKNGDKETFRKLFLRLHDRDQNEVFHLLYPEKKRKIAEFLTPEEFSEMFEWMVVEDQEDAIDYLPDHYLKEVIDHLANDDVVYFVTNSGRANKNKILNLLSSEERDNVHELLSYAEETAGSIMTKEFISVYENQTTQKIIEQLRTIGKNAETIYYIYITDKTGILLGVLSLRDLLLAPPDTIVNDIMNEQLITVQVNQDQEEVAKIIQDYDLLAVPVLTVKNGRMQGIITVDDIIDVLKEERTEDLNEFAGIRKEDPEKTGMLHTALNRSQWLIIFMILSFFVGGLMNLFEDTLQQAVILSAFVPLIMGTSGNVGTQSLAVSLKSGIVGQVMDRKKFTHVLKNEFKSGLLMAVPSAIIIFLLISILYGELIIASIVSASIFIGISLSTVLGTAVPIFISKFNIDPSIASGPFITTITDGMALLIYFTVATTLL